MSDRSLKFVCVKSELLTPSIKQAMGQNIKKNSKFGNTYKNKMVDN